MCVAGVGVGAGWLLLRAPPSIVILCLRTSFDIFHILYSSNLGEQMIQCPDYFHRACHQCVPLSSGGVLFLTPALSFPE